MPNPVEKIIELAKKGDRRVIIGGGLAIGGGVGLFVYLRNKRNGTGGASNATDQTYGYGITGQGDLSGGGGGGSTDTSGGTGSGSTDTGSGLSLPTIPDLSSGLGVGTDSGSGFSPLPDLGLGSGGGAGSGFSLPALPSLGDVFGNGGLPDLGTYQNAAMPDLGGFSNSPLPSLPTYSGGNFGNTLPDLPSTSPALNDSRVSIQTGIQDRQTPVSMAAQASAVDGFSVGLQRASAAQASAKAGQPIAQAAQQLLNSQLAGYQQQYGQAPKTAVSGGDFQALEAQVQRQAQQQQINAASEARRLADNAQSAIVQQRAAFAQQTAQQQSQYAQQAQQMYNQQLASYRQQYGQAPQTAMSSGDFQALEAQARRLGYQPQSNQQRYSQTAQQMLNSQQAAYQNQFGQRSPVAVSSGDFAALQASAQSQATQQASAAQQSYNASYQSALAAQASLNSQQAAYQNQYNQAPQTAVSGGDFQAIQAAAQAAANKNKGISTNNQGSRRY